MARGAFALVLCVVVASVASVSADKYRDVLMQLYDATGGASWNNNDGWGSQDNYCTWYGVSCPLHTTQDVTEVMLSKNNLVGTIPATIGMINTLKNLDLSNNKLSGSLPPVFGNMPNLVMLDVSYNSISGSIPSHLVNFTNWPTLRILNLQNNSLSGSIPEDLFGPETLPPFYPALNIQTFNAEYNQLTGPIPTRITRGNVMRTFMVGFNQMDSIPESVNDWLTGRKYCDLEGNDWACPVNTAVSKNCKAYCSS